MLYQAIAYALRDRSVRTNPRHREEEHSVNGYILGFAGVTVALAAYGAYRHIKRKRDLAALAQQVPVPQP